MNDKQLGIDRVAFCDQRRELTSEKMAIQGRLSEINAACKNRLPNSTYSAFQNERASLVSRLAILENQISEISQRIREVSAVEYIGKKSSFSINGVREIVEIRDKYHDMSMDDGVPSPVRKIYWKFSQELRAILKPYFDEGN